MIDFGGSGRDVNVSGTGRNGGKDSIAGLGDAVKEKRGGKEKEKVDGEYPGMELWKGNYIHSTLWFELFHSQVPLLMGWNDKKPSTEGNKTSIEATSAPISLPEVAATVLAMLPMPLPELPEFLV